MRFHNYGFLPRRSLFNPRTVEEVTVGTALLKLARFYPATRRFIITVPESYKWQVGRSEKSVLFHVLSNNNTCIVVLYT